MKNDMGMRYRRIQVVALHTNSVKNRILRQQFAIQMVNLLNQGKRIINVDESWLNTCDFRRMKWRAHGDNNSLAKTQVSPRISMIVGIETTGAVYLSLLQANNDSKTMEIFFKSLARKLDAERPDWRKNTVILLDNVSIIHSHSHPIQFQAPYHASSAAYDMMAGLKLPVLFTGTHSYDACPCELWFAHFKNGDLNPNRAKTGKR